MNKSLGLPLSFLLFLTIIFSNTIHAQTIRVLDGNDTLKTNSIGIKVNLLLKDSVINLNLGPNKLAHINPKDCRAIQIIYATDTSNFWEIVEFAKGTDSTLLRIMKMSEPDYSLILKTDWTIILDKYPYRNKDLVPLIAKDPARLDKSKSIIAMKTVEFMWSFMDSKID